MPSATMLVTMFLAGAATAVLAVLAGAVQRSYYRAARDLEGLIERRLELGDLAIGTTQGMRGRPHRVTVRLVQDLLMSTLGLAHVVGIVTTIALRT